MVFKSIRFYRIGIVWSPQYAYNQLGLHTLLYFFNVFSASWSSSLVPLVLQVIFLQYPPPIGKNPLGQPPSAFDGIGAISVRELNAKPSATRTFLSFTWDRAVDRQ
jgi:hypothetical protein